MLDLVLQKAKAEVASSTVGSQAGLWLLLKAAVHKSYMHRFASSWRYSRSMVLALKPVLFDPYFRPVYLTKLQPSYWDNNFSSTIQPFATPEFLAEGSALFTGVVQSKLANNFQMVVDRGYAHTEREQQTGFILLTGIAFFVLCRLREVEVGFPP